MNTTVELAKFDLPDLARIIDGLSAEELDQLDFGVIGFDDSGLVFKYNRRESQLAGLSRERVVGSHLFEVVAPCMNNFLVAQRFEDALASGSTLDAVVDYVFTLRMRPTKVKLRLLSDPALTLRYVLVQRRA